MSYNFRRKSTGERMIVLAAAIVLTCLSGWSLMLAVGVVHHEWIEQCPTLGYWWAVLLASLIRSALYTHDWDKESGR